MSLDPSKVIDVEQGSDEWHAARCGRITASRVADVVAKTKSGYAASRQNYLAEIVTERLTGVQAEGFVSPAMRWGTEQEPAARFEYEMRYDVVEQVGFVVHPSLDYAGASPDGGVEDWRGLVQIKCPNTWTHLTLIRTGKIDSRYMTQVQWEMACTGAEWCDFVSYDPRIKHERLQFWCIRVPRDDARIAELQAEVEKFDAEARRLEAELLEAVK